MNKSGQEVNASIVLPDNDNYELENNDGVLQVIQSGRSSTNVLPAGSYSQSCRDVRVLLQCDARKIDGEYVKALIDLTDLKAPDIENCDGILIDDNVLDAALDDVSKLMPEHAKDINGRKKEIKAYMAGTYTPDKAAIPAAPAQALASSESKPGDSNFLGMSPCMQSCAVLIVDVFVSLLAYRGYGRAKLEAIVASEEVGAALLGRDVQNAAQELAGQIRNPIGVASFAEALVRLFAAVATVSLVKAIIKAVADQLSWWDMVKFSAAMLAQSVALFSLAGPAVVYAKGVLLSIALEGLLEDSVHVVEDCA